MPLRGSSTYGPFLATTRPFNDRPPARRPIGFPRRRPSRCIVGVPFAETRCFGSARVSVGPDWHTRLPPSDMGGADLPPVTSSRPGNALPRSDCPRGYASRAERFETSCAVPARLLFDERSPRAQRDYADHAIVVSTTGSALLALGHHFHRLFDRDSPRAQMMSPWRTAHAVIAAPRRLLPRTAVSS